MESQQSVNESHLSLTEFDSPAKLESYFCEPITEQEYATTMKNTTEKAIKDLIAYLDDDPSIYRNLLHKKRHDELQAQGLFTLLKNRLISTMKGKGCDSSTISEEEFNQQFDDLKKGMLMAYNYSQKNNGGERFSKRLLLKRTMSATVKKVSSDEMLSDVKKLKVHAVPSLNSYHSVTDVMSYDASPYSCLDRGSLTRRPLRATKSTAGSYERLCSEVPIGNVTSEIMPPPPSYPPPAPPIPCEPLLSAGGIGDDHGVIMSPPNSDKTDKKLFDVAAKDVICSTPKPGCLPFNKFHKSTTSLVTVHDELIACDVQSKLKTTNIPRTPGRTPLNNMTNKSLESLSYTNPLNNTEPLGVVMMRMLDAKFKNTRSPTPTGRLHDNVTTPSTAFSSPDFTP